MEMFSYKEPLSIAQSIRNSSKIYNVSLFSKIVVYKMWQSEGHHCIEVYVCVSRTSVTNLHVKLNLDKLK